MTGGVIFGAFRGLTSIVKRFRRPRKAERWPGQVSKDGGGRGGAGAAPGDRARRARESLLMQAGGMHVPVDVVAGLDEFELEVCIPYVGRVQEKKKRYLHQRNIFDYLRISFFSRRYPVTHKKWQIMRSCILHGCIPSIPRLTKWLSRGCRALPCLWVCCIP